MLSERLQFSVVIPTYNREAFLRTAIESVLAQEFEDFEILVVDDGSTDDTALVVERLRNPLVHYQRTRHSERGAARNLGARLSRGDYINFMDSDDLAYPHHLATAHRFLRENHRPELFHLGYDVKDQNGRVLWSADRLPNPVNDRLIDGNHLSCNGVFLRRDIAVAHPFKEDRALAGSEDYELWLRLASRYPVWCDNTVTTSIVDHRARSVLAMDEESLLKRIQMLVDSLRSDPAFMKVYGPGYSRFRSALEVYVALHLALGKGGRLASLFHLYRAFTGDPRVFLDRKFYGVLKQNALSIVRRHADVF